MRGFNCLNALEFATDTDISGHATLRERKLQPWIPDSDIPAVSLE
jgi:PAB1-binding protein PBP1